METKVKDSNTIRMELVEALANDGWGGLELKQSSIDPNSRSIAAIRAHISIFARSLPGFKEADKELISALCKATWRTSFKPQDYSQAEQDEAIENLSRLSSQSIDDCRQRVHEYTELLRKERSIARNGDANFEVQTNIDDPAFQHLKRVIEKLDDKESLMKGVSLQLVFHHIAEYAKIKMLNLKDPHIEVLLELTQEGPRIRSALDRGEKTTQKVIESLIRQNLILEEDLICAPAVLYIDPCVRLFLKLGNEPDSGSIRSELTDVEVVRQLNELKKIYFELASMPGAKRS